LGHVSVAAKSIFALSKMHVRPVFLMFLVFFFAACFNQGDCIITSSSLARISLFSKKDGKARPTKFTSVVETNDQLEFVVGADTTVSSLQLPLHPDRLQVSYVLVTPDSTYNLTLSYTTYTRIIATDCGAFLYYQDLSVDSTNFDRYKIIQPQLFKSVTTNLEIFF
jgi:hypothetical protein